VTDVTHARHEVHPPSVFYQSAAGRHGQMRQRVELSDHRGATLLGETGPMVPTFSRPAAPQRGRALTPEPEPAEPVGVVRPANGDDGAGATDPAVTIEELTILTLMANGMTLDSVAIRVSMSPRTLSRRLRCVCDRLGVAHPIQAIVWAARQGLI
jgi:DNA-binding CsgD family transcriptional regulator